MSPVKEFTMWEVSQSNSLSCIAIICEMVAMCFCRLASWRRPALSKWTFTATVLNTVLVFMLSIVFSQSAKRYGLSGGIQASDLFSTSKSMAFLMVGDKRIGTILPSSPGTFTTSNLWRELHNVKYFLHCWLIKFFYYFLTQQYDHELDRVGGLWYVKFTSLHCTGCPVCKSMSTVHYNFAA